MSQNRPQEDPPLPRRKNTVILGPSGSGKTELAAALALSLAEEEGGEVWVFDMDQTKALFRLRDIAPALASRGIRVVHGEEFMDSPLVPPGVAEALADPARRVILDVGGDLNGARSLGRYRGLLGEETTQFFLPVNPFRRPGLTPQALWAELRGILSWTGREEAFLLCDPWRGPDGGPEAALEGGARLTRLLEPLGLSWKGLMLPEELGDRVVFPGKRVIYIRPRISGLLELG